MSAHAALDASLRRVHRSVLVLLALCALVAASAPVDEPGDVTAPDHSTITLCAVALAGGSVLARRLATAPRVGPGRRLWLGLASLLLAGGVGIAGVAAALMAGDRSAGLLYTLGGASLILRPLRPSAAPRDPV